MPGFVTFSRNVFIPVTNICRNRCGYCTFRRDHDHPEARLMNMVEIRQILENGQRAGCTEALFVFGEYADEVPEYLKELKGLGYSNTIEYVSDLCELAIDIGLLPHTNAGILTEQELKALKPLNVSMGLMLETTAELKAHNDSPGKVPSKRIEMIRTAGKLKIPFTTGILVGIGETKEQRIHSLETIAEIQNEFGHIQEVIIQNFMPKKGTLMEDHAPPSKDEMIETVSLAKKILPETIAIQVAPNLIDPYTLIKAGATDLGGISPTTIDWINPEAEWPDVIELQNMTKEIELKERLPIYPQYIEQKWYSSNLFNIIGTLADKNGFKRKQQ